MPNTDISSSLGNIFDLTYFKEHLRDGQEIRSITIPDFQRPYCWTMSDIQKLQDDVDEFRYDAVQEAYDSNVNYFFGSFCFRVRTDEKDKTSVTLEILDGQQRLTSFLLLAHVITEEAKDIAELAELKDLMGFKDKDLSPFADRFFVEQPQSRRHISEILLALRSNYRALKSMPELLAETLKRDIKRYCYFLKHGSAAVLLLESRTEEAEQFFQGENNRGKAMSTLDILKAYHMRHALDGIKVSENHKEPEVLTTEEDGKIREELGEQEQQEERNRRVTEIQTSLNDDAVINRFVIPAMLVKFGIWSVGEDNPENSKYLKGIPPSTFGGRLVDIKRKHHPSPDVGNQNPYIPDMMDTLTPGMAFFKAVRYYGCLSKVIQKIFTQEKESFEAKKTKLLFFRYDRAEDFLHIAMLFWLDRFLKFPSSMTDKDSEAFLTDPGRVIKYIQSDYEFFLYMNIFRSFLNRLKNKHPQLRELQGTYDRLETGTICRCLAFENVNENLLLLPYRAAGPSACRTMLVGLVSPDSSFMKSRLGWRIADYQKASKIE